MCLSDIVVVEVLYDTFSLKKKACGIREPEIH